MSTINNSNKFDENPLASLCFLIISKDAIWGAWEARIILCPAYIRFRSVPMPMSYVTATLVGILWGVRCWYLLIEALWKDRLLTLIRLVSLTTRIINVTFKLRIKRSVKAHVKLLDPAWYVVALRMVGWLLPLLLLLFLFAWAAIRLWRYGTQLKLHFELTAEQVWESGLGLLYLRYPGTVGPPCSWELKINTKRRCLCFIFWACCVGPWTWAALGIADAVAAQAILRRKLGLSPLLAIIDFTLRLGTWSLTFWRFRLSAGWF